MKVQTDAERRRESEVEDVRRKMRRAVHSIVEAHPLGIIAEAYKRTARAYDELVNPEPGS